MSFRALYHRLSTTAFIGLLLFLFPAMGEAQYTDVLIRCQGEVHWEKDGISGTKEEKAVYVYDKLQKLSEKAQAPLISFLHARNIPFEAYSVVNAVHAVVPNALLSEIRSVTGVLSVAENTPFEEERADYTPNGISPRSVGPEWGILHIHADSVWALGYRGQGVVVGGQDTGFDWEHPALRSKYRGDDGDGPVQHSYNWHDAIHEINPLNGDSTLAPENNPCGLNTIIPCDDNGHGTHTMGTMVGSDGENEIGVAPEAKWIACRNMERGWGMPSTYLECMEWFLAPTDAADMNPDPLKAPHVINNSWSCPEEEGCNPDNFELMRQAVVNLRAAGVVVVVSAGNSGNSCGSVSTPLAMFEESFTVGAINASDTIANFSSRGPVEVDSSFRTKPNISAPGVQVRSSWPDSTYRNASGTSMAGPHVAGVVALMISANPELAGQVELIEDILEETARPKTTLQECGGVPGTAEWNNTFGHGVIDALAAVEAALLVTSTDDVQNENAELLFYPNPVTHDLNIVRREGDTVMRSLRIYTMDGRLIAVRENFQTPGRLQMQDLAPGLYIVKADQYPPARIHVLH